MRRALHFLTIVTVLMCGLHVGEPAQAHALTDQLEHAAVADAVPDDGDPADQGTEKAAHANHHHCPIAAEQKAPAPSDNLLLGDPILFARPIAAMKSFSQAPPVEPPSA
jgi:hypothetical protein